MIIYALFLTKSAHAYLSSVFVFKGDCPAVCVRVTWLFILCFNFCGTSLQNFPPVCCGWKFTLYKKITYIMYTVGENSPMILT